MKPALLALMALILVALFSGLYFLMKEEGESQKSLKSLIVRIGLSVIFILLIIVSFYMGWITPHLP